MRCSVGLMVLVLMWGSAAYSADYQIVKRQGMMNFVHIDDGASRGDVLQAAERVCAGFRVCIAMFWTDKYMVPLATPMRDDQIAAKFAHYNRNQNSGLDRLLMCDSDGC